MFNVESILQSANLRQLCEQAGAEFDTHGRSCCPIHGGDNPSAFSLYHKDGKDLWYCYSGDCGGGDAISFIQKWQGLDFKNACAFLGGDVVSDPVAMERSAQERLEKAKAEHEAAAMRVEARRKELQVAQKHLYYHDNMQEWAVDAWIGRGLDEGLQSFFTLGACEAFDIGGYNTPTLTIPIFDTENNLLNIKHRLMKPIKPNDKYRPETSGLGTFPPMLCVPMMGYDGERIVVVEGEIKAMVTWAHINADYQVIGVAGKSHFSKLAGQLAGKRVIVIPDPGGEKEAWELAKAIGASWLQVPEKIDDYLLETGMDNNSFYSLLKQARKI